ncbi:MAG: glycerol-3-phosphate 1-O-acyltransferase PlsY [Gloeomargaritaceae cyanobacterium C42_A2020_066]|nr:glycerol-3-phosphate 1-O-acyltransferase PlsY [Gloeomargaritaceae cyanobacterium C42_A2020_066]
MLTAILVWLALGLAAYGLGSIPTGYLAGRLRGIDIRTVGSGSTGATNVLRTLGRGPALVVFLVDLGKGATAILLWRWVAHQWPGLLEVDTAWYEVWAAAAALVGHSKPVWIGFQGGKSVATGLGLLVVLSWPVALGALGVFGLTLLVSRIVSLGSILAALAAVVLMGITHQPLPYLLFAISGATYVIARHRSNLQRLAAGREPRLGEKLPGEPTESSLVQPES